MIKVKIALSNPGGELDSVVTDAEHEEDHIAINDALDDLIADHDWHVGDSLTITQENEDEQQSNKRR